MPYWDWENEIDEQVIPYARQFRPRKALLITRYTVPNNVKEKLSSNGIEVIENVRLGGRGINKLMEVINGMIT